MANEVSEFESFLTGYAAHQYNSKRFGVGWLRVEVRGRAAALSKQLQADMIHFEQLRAAIAVTLAMDPNDQPKSAAKWASFLKPRIEMLDFWASLIGAIGALGVGGCALLAVLNSHEKSASEWYVAAGAALGLIFGIVRFEIDRRKLWYKYLVSHLDAIKATLSPRS